MPCRTMPLPGGFAIVCSRGRQQPKCSVPGCHGKTVALCDATLATGKTCSARLCEYHRTEREPGVDFCPPHQRAAAAAKAAP